MSCRKARTPWPRDRRDRPGRAAWQPREIRPSKRLKTSIGERPLRVDVEPLLRAVRMDTSRMDRVLANLLQNAINYLPLGSLVGVSARRTGVDCGRRAGGHSPPNNAIVSSICRSANSLMMDRTCPATAATRSDYLPTPRTRQRGCGSHCLWLITSRWTCVLTLPVGSPHKRGAAHRSRPTWPGPRGTGPPCRGA
jgi:hypothetical protein